MKYRSKLRSRPRGLTSLLLAISTVTALASCSDATDNNTERSEDASHSSGYYPVSLQTPYGDVSIDEYPERIVALDPTVASSLVSLGVTPAAVATTPDYLSSLPWAPQEFVDTADPEINTSDGINIERVADLNPDVIVGSSYMLDDESVRAELGNLAPVFTPDNTDQMTDWRETLRSMSRLVDKESEAGILVSDIEKDYRRLGEEVPDISSKTYTVSGYQNDVFFYGNGEALSMVGMTPAESQDNHNQSRVSIENSGDLSANLMVVKLYVDKDNTSDSLKNKVGSIPIFQEKSSDPDSTIVYDDGNLVNAMVGFSPLSAPWLADQLADILKEL